LTDTEQKIGLYGRVDSDWAAAVSVDNIQLSVRRSQLDVVGLEVAALALMTLPISSEVLPPVATSRMIRHSETRALRFELASARMVDGEAIFQAANEVSLLSVDLKQAVQAATLANQLSDSKLRECCWLIPDTVITLVPSHS
jgi:hypothetical protein